jgi:hypothetical protein
MTIDVFTISSNNYLGMTRVLAESYLEHHPGATVHVCLVDRRDDRVPYDALPFDLILAEDLGIPSFQNFAFRYDILELNTAVKPFVFKHLRDVVGLDRAFYFDPDILVHDRLTALEKALQSHQAVLTPHLTQPLDNRCRPPERVIGMCGVYNLGFLGLRLDGGTASFLDWWCERLHRYCIVDLANGMFVDQSWMDFAPAYLESVAIVRDPIFNIAYWNLPHRPLEWDGSHWRVDRQRVGFFHFSGVDLDDLDIISRHQDRTDLWRRPELKPLFDDYRELVAQSGQEDVRGIPYHWDRFSGTDIEIPWVGRIALQEVDPLGLRWKDPFDAEARDSYLAWLAKPLVFQGRLVNRASCYLWRERPDVRAEFPDIEGVDLARYLDWYLDKGATEAGLDEIFIEPLRHIPPQPAGESRRDEEREEVARIDLRDPGEKTGWLNDLAVGGDGPRVTRLAMVIHRTRPDVNRLYPDPLGHDRAGLAYWTALHGARDYRLHEDLVRPIRESLTAKSRWTLPVRRLWLELTTRAPSIPMKIDPPPLPPPPEVPPEDPLAEGMQQLLERLPTAGVNIVGRFDDAMSFAACIRDGLSEAGVPHATVSLDHELPGQMTTDRIRHEAGAPFPLTLLALPPEEWKRTVSRLPLGSRIGGRLIGYVVDASASLSDECGGLVEELWTPSEELARAVSENTLLPIRVVPPIVEPPLATSRELVPDLDPQRFWFLAVDGRRGPDDDRAVSAAIECVRRLARNGDFRVGLCLAVGPEKSELTSQLQHLPIGVVSRPLEAATLNALISASDGFLDLHTSPRVDPALVKAAMSGLPVVTGWDLTGGDGHEIGDLGVVLQRIAEIAAYPDTERNLASASMDDVRELHSVRTSSQVWRLRVGTEAIDHDSKGLAGREPVARGGESAVD